MNNDKLKGLMWGALLGDAYALAGHLISEPQELQKAQLNLSSLNNPLSSLHPTKQAGDFTNYGDQLVWLLEYMKESQVYDPFVFGKVWQKNMAHYNGYIDKASQESLANLNSGRTPLGAGSGSHDLSVVGRHAPIMYLLKGMDEMLESVKFHTCLTHMSKECLDASKYIAEVTLAMIYNLDVEKTLQERAKFYGKEVELEVEKAFKLKELPTGKAIAQLGNGSAVEGGLASTIHLILNHHENFSLLLEENLLAAGDTSARAMIAGMIVGARYGFEAIQPSWIEEINEYETLSKIIG